MRTSTVLTAAVLLLTTLTACSSEPSPPAYTVTNDVQEQRQHGTFGHVELLLPDATVPEAQAAIRAYAETIDGPQMYEIAVVRDTGSTVLGRPATIYVCMGRWVKDQQASADWAGGSITSDTWPAIGMHCPDHG